VEQTLAIVRNALSESAFANAWAAGQHMTLEQAMAEALALSKHSPVVASWSG
jgi:hypothetical protein